MTASLAHRSRNLLPALLLAAGLITLHVLIGGRGLVFALPGLTLIAASVLIAVVLADRHWRPSASWSCLGATAVFVAYILTRAAATPGYFARADLFTVAGAAAVYFATALFITTTRARLTILALLMSVSLVDVVISAVQFTRADNFMLIPFLQRADYGLRASGFLVCPNHLAGFLEIVGVFGLALACWSRCPVWLKLLIGYATGMVYVGLALTASRGGYLSAAGSITVFAFLSIAVVRAGYPRRWRGFAAAGLVLLLIVLCAATMLIQHNSFLHDRAANVIDRENVRITLWQAAVRQWELQPIVGTGAGTYRVFGREFRTKEMQNDPVDVHNDYLHLLCEYGILGAAAFLVFFGVHLRQGRHTVATLLRRISSGHGATQSNRLAVTLGVWAAIAAYVVHSFVDFNLHIPANALLLAFVFGMAANPALTQRRLAESARPRLIKFATAGCAAMLLAAAVRFAPAELLKERARTTLRDEDPAGAIRLATDSIHYDGKDPETYFFLGRAFMACGHQSRDLEEARFYFGKAIAAFRDALQLAPLDGTYALDLAFACDEAGQFDDAERMFAVARRRDPHSSAVAQLYIAHLHARVQDEGTM